MISCFLNFHDLRCLSNSTGSLSRSIDKNGREPCEGTAAWLLKAQTLESDPWVCLLSLHFLFCDLDKLLHFSVPQHS